MEVESIETSFSEEEALTPDLSGEKQIRDS